MLKAILWLLTFNFSIEVQPNLFSPPDSGVYPDTESVKYVDEQGNYWPCIVYAEGALCQKDGNSVIVYLPEE